jgi:hypothetical protein
VNLAERLAATNAGLPGAMCAVCRLLTELAEPDHGTLTQALAGTDYTAKQIAAALTAEGHRVTGGTVARHRRKECRGLG